ncbi:hypothetical protein R84B8_01191 [Treponema sp. R8-4-B8]
MPRVIGGKKRVPRLNYRLNRNALLEMNDSIGFFRNIFGNIAANEDMFWAILTKGLCDFVGIDDINVFGISFKKLGRIVVKPSNLRFCVVYFMQNRLVF